MPKQQILLSLSSGENVIFHFLKKIFSGDHNERVFSRAKAKLVIVCNEEFVRPYIPEDDYSNSHATKIKVLGEACFQKVVGTILGLYVYKIVK